MKAIVYTSVLIFLREKLTLISKYVFSDFISFRSDYYQYLIESLLFYLANSNEFHSKHSWGKRIKLFLFNNKEEKIEYLHERDTIMLQKYCVL